MGNSVDWQASLDDYRWVVGLEGAKWLAEVTAAGKQKSLVSLAATLRRDLSAARVHLLLEQVELRQRAREKFSQAEQMFFTPLALEQATDQWVAAYKAGRFPPGSAVADLCCGIGGDLLALARGGPVWAIDRNPVAVILAQANAAAVLGSGDSGLSLNANVEVKDAAEIVSELRDMAAWHIDPDRRATGRRTTKVEFHEPGPAILERLLAACPNAAIKLAPAADLPEPWWQSAELEWISRDRQCRQLVAWFGNLAQHTGLRRATVLPNSRAAGSHSADSNAGQRAFTFVGEPNLECPLAAQIGRYVFEPDAALLAAELEGALAAQYGLQQVAPGVAYFTSDSAVDCPALECFEVVEVMSYRVKAVREWLRERNIGRLEVKKRGVQLDPEQVRRDLLADQHGEQEIALLLARIAGRVTAMMAQRVRKKN